MCIQEDTYLVLVYKSQLTKKKNFDIAIFIVIARKEIAIYKQTKQQNTVYAIIFLLLGNLGTYS